MNTMYEVRTALFFTALRNPPELEIRQAVADLPLYIIHWTLLHNVSHVKPYGNAVADGEA